MHETISKALFVSLLWAVVFVVVVFVAAVPEGFDKMYKEKVQVQYNNTKRIKLLVFSYLTAIVHST